MQSLSHAVHSGWVCCFPPHARPVAAGSHLGVCTTAVVGAQRGGGEREYSLGRVSTALRESPCTRDGHPSRWYTSIKASVNNSDVQRHNSLSSGISLQSDTWHMDTARLCEEYVNHRLLSLLRVACADIAFGIAWYSSACIAGSLYCGGLPDFFCSTSKIASGCAVHRLDLVNSAGCIDWPQDHQRGHVS